MRQYSIFTNEYDINIRSLLKRRVMNVHTAAATMLCNSICDTYSSDALQGEASAIDICISTSEELQALCEALIGVMLIDLRYFELSDLVSKQPLSFEDKKAILMSSLERTAAPYNIDAHTHALIEYLNENNRLNLEGYIRFRLRDAWEEWAAAVDASIADMFESEVLFDLLDSFKLIPFISDNDPVNLAVILNPDGSCTITNSSFTVGSSNSEKFRIDCAPGAGIGVLNILNGMSHCKISIFDMSMGTQDELKSEILRLFNDDETKN